MNILIYSDLHLEFAPFQPPDAALEQADLVVLAGDIHLGARGIEWAIDTFADLPMVYVPGNHEYYPTPGSRPAARGQLFEQMRQAAKASGGRVHLLNRGEVQFKGVRILGATLWTDFRLLMR